MDQTSVFAEIVKTAPQEDGSLLVYGKATGSDLDLDQQRCSPEWLKRAMPEWFKIGNVREQHDAKRAVGKAIEHEQKADGHWITAKIVDPVAKAKTEAGIFTGFSIGIKGPRIEKSADAPGGMITDGSICEVSLVDRPCLPTATLTVCKAAAPGMEINAADFDEERGLVKVEEFLEKAADADEPDVAKEAAVLDDIVTETEEEVEAARNAGDSPSDGCGCCPKCTIATQQTEEAAAAFDKAAAKALVAQVLKNHTPADDDGDSDGDLPPTYDEEQGDIEGAQNALQCIFQLIISEAQDACDNPAQDCDIELLMQAVQALRCYIHREQQQQMGANIVKKPEMIVLDAEPELEKEAAEPDVEKAKYSAEQLRDLLSQGKAIKNANGEPSFPIADKEDLHNAIRAVGRGSGDHDRIRAYIIRRAKALGASNMIPDNWSSGGSNKAAEAEGGAETTVYVDGEPIDKSAKAEKKAAKKAAKAELAKAAVEGGADPEALVKALAAALEKADNPLRKSFEAVVEASTRSTVDRLGELGERLERVEKMAAPGGPALRRTDVERKQARARDLETEVQRLKTLALSTDDRKLRDGYTQMAKAVEAEIAAL
jgi:hypothetical protein